MAENVAEQETTSTPDASTRPVIDLLKPETCPPALKKFYSDIQREAIRMALERGQIKTEQKTVKVTKETAKSDKDETWDYISYSAIEAPGMTALAGGRAGAKKPKPENYDQLDANAKKRADTDNEDGACDYFNYGYGLTITQPIRNYLMSKVGGPEKEIAKQITQMMRTGLFESDDEARAVIIAQRKKMGEAVPE